MESQPTAPRGLVAGKYEVVRLIGRGGMGAVWEGRHASLGTRVAIKFIDQEYAESKEARSRFDTEARAAAALQSKHAIQIFDHGVTEDGRPYMVMEMLTGEPLDERLDRLRRIRLEDTARILAQVCRALQRAHDAGIIHRDLKPENIFLVRSPDDDDEIAQVLDFGIAKIKAPPGEQGLSSSTKTGAVLGTPYYMAPEQARGLRSIDYRADLWSIGVIAYKCVTGILPFEGESVGDLLVKICTAPAPIPSLTLPGLPPAFDAWFSRTMEREPARRFVSATELADGLLTAAGLSVRRPPMSSEREPPGMTPMA
ncbi:MAG: serine/threonine-protein kinase, partial [Polyangiaceae bacterium]